MLVPCNPDGPLLRIYPNEKNQNDALRFTHAAVHWGPVMRKMETTQVFFNWRMIKTTVNLKERRLCSHLKHDLKNI